MNKAPATAATLATKIKDIHMFCTSTNLQNQFMNSYVLY